MACIRFFCVNCGWRITVSPDFRETHMTCPSCFSLVRVPTRSLPGELIGVETWLKFKCGVCSSRLSVDQTLAGFTVTCTRCGSATTVPEWTRPEERWLGPPSVASKSVLTPAEIEYLTAKEGDPPKPGTGDHSRAA